MLVVVTGRKPSLVGVSPDLLSGKLRDVKQSGGILGRGSQGVLKHAVAKRAGRAHRIRSRCGQFFCPGFIYPRRGFFAEKDQPSTRTTAETPLTCARWLDHRRGTRNHLPRLVVDPTIPAQIARIVKYHAPAIN